MTRRPAAGQACGLAVILLATLLLSACGIVPACRLEAVADLPATIEDNRLEVTGQVNGADIRLVVDTGAERSLLTTQTVAALGLPRSQRSGTRLVGVGGTVSNADVYAQLALGAATRAERLAVADIPGVGGVIGGDVLSRYDVELDVPGRRVRLWQATGCEVADLPWTGRRQAIAVDVTATGRLRLPVTVDGQTMLALLDSGAALSLMQADIARRMDVTPDALAADPAYAARGVDGTPIDVHRHRFGRLVVGMDRFARPLIGVAAFQLNAADMLLGVDYLRVRRVWIAYRSGLVFVQSATPGGA